MSTPAGSNTETEFEVSPHYTELEQDNSLKVDDLSEKSRSFKKKVIAMTGVVVVLLFAGTGYHLGWFSGGNSASSDSPLGPPPVQVAIAHAKTMTMSPHTILPGTVVSVRDAVIASETSGKVLSVSYIGDIINVGDSIAEIDPQDAQQLVDQRRAELQKLQSLYNYHHNYFQRIGAQENKLGVSEIGIAELKSNRDTAKADVARAMSELKAAENALRRTSIKAPFAGRVVSQSIQPGEYAQVGSPIVRLVDTNNLEVSAQVPAALVQPIQAGTLLEVTGLNKTLKAPMRTLVPVGDSISRTMELRVTLSDSDFLVGSPVRVSLPSAQTKQVVAVPRDAVILRTESQYVFVIDETGKAHRQDVELGYADGDMIEVIGNVQPQQTVVVRGGERLRDGQNVAWKDQSSSEAVVSK